MKCFLFLQQMRRSFGQFDAMSPIRSPNPRLSMGNNGAVHNGGSSGGFALAGLNIGGSKNPSQRGNTTPKP